MVRMSFFIVYNLFVGSCPAS